MSASSMKTPYLNKEEREVGSIYFLRWSAFNGLGFSFLGDTVVTLMAMHFGASNLQLGYISSVIHFSGVTLLIFPWLLAGMNIARVQYYSWLLRGLICLLYAALFWLTGQAAVLTILAIYTMFCVFRMFGTAASSAIQAMLSTPSNTGDWVVRLSNSFQITRLLSQGISVVIMSFSAQRGMAGYAALIALGVIMNTASAWQLTRVPCRETVAYQPGKNLFHIFAENMRDRERALILFVKWHALSLMIALSFTLPFLRKVARLEPNLIFLFSIAVTLATIAAGYGMRPFTDRVGSRPVLILGSLLLAALSLIWCVVPATLHWSIFFALGFMTTLAQTAVTLLVSRLEIRAIPEDDKIGYVSMMNASSALIALFAGLFIGLLADLGERFAFPGINSFGLAFFAAALLALQVSLLSVFLKDAGSLSVRDTAQILFSTRNLRAFLDVHYFHLADDLNTRKAILLSISKSDTPVAVDEMRRIFRSPLSPEKEEILKSLFAYPNPALLKDILREAADESSYHRTTAIFTLGAYPHRKVEKFLRSLLHHPAESVRSNAAKSLARVGDRSALPDIRRRLMDASLSMSDRMNYLIAVSVMDKEGAYLTQIFDIANCAPETPNAAQTLFALTAKMLEMEPPLAEIFQRENLRETDGLSLLLEDAKTAQPFFERAPTLLRLYRHRQYQEITAWCQEVLAHQRLSAPFAHLKDAMLARHAQQARRDDTLAMLYFTYQALK